MKRFRPAWAEVDLEAIRSNLRAVAALAGARVCAVVKADAYGHGAEPTARAALDAGAAWLAVALVEEAVALRDAGIDAPILLLSEPPPEAMAEVAARRLTATVYTMEGIRALAAVRSAGSSLSVHLKVDTGMHRVGAAPDRAVDLAEAIVAAGLRLEGLWTHFAVADEPERLGFTEGQLAALDRVRAALARAGIVPPLLHAANSAGALLVRAGLDLVRVGIALYGYQPNPACPAPVELRPALSLRARVSHVQVVRAQEAVSYGLERPFPRDTVVATVPLGYADGVPRRLGSTGGEVLIGGRRRPIAGTVTMDHVMVDCGDDARVARGDEVVLLGVQGAERITADDWAARLGTLSYEVVCGISARVPRVYR